VIGDDFLGQVVGHEGFLLEMGLVQQGRIKGELVPVDSLPSEFNFDVEPQFVLLLLKDVLGMAYSGALILLGAKALDLLLTVDFLLGQVLDFQLQGCDFGLDLLTIPLRGEVLRF
jgi:hypothetical protein